LKAIEIKEEEFFESNHAKGWITSQVEDKLRKQSIKMTQTILTTIIGYYTQSTAINQLFTKQSGNQDVTKSLN